MTCWYEGPLAAFDTETTGVDVETDRIVSAAVVVQQGAGTRPRVTRWLVNPGIPVPEESTAVHGLTEDHLQRNGRWPAPVMEEIARDLAEQGAAGRPIVVMNAPFDLTILDRELRRHRASSLSRYMEGSPLCVIDPRSWTSTWTATARAAAPSPTCARTTRWSWPRRTDAAADAQAALDVVRAVGRRFAARLERLSPAELHTLQAVWHAGRRAACRRGSPRAVHRRPWTRRGRCAPNSARRPERRRRARAARHGLGGGTPGQEKTGPSADGRHSPGGRYWVRTSDLFGVNEALSH